jgi:DNA-directed RNA polymerase subunit RPC12/RpoP
VLSHNYKAVVTETTCTDYGFTTYTCSRCGDEYVEDSPAALMKHDYKAKVTEATCTDYGFTTYACSRCGDKYVVEGAHVLMSHNYKAITTIASTCMEDGSTSYACTYCGDEYVTDGAGVLGHDYFLVDRSAPTLTEEGYEYFQCRRCHEEYSSALPKLTVNLQNTYVSWFNKNLQNTNSQNLAFKVTVALSDGSTFINDHNEKVDNQQKGSKTFAYAYYSVYAVWDDNNTVTTCVVK